MNDSSREKVPIRLIDKLNKGLSGAEIVEKAIAVAKLDGNVINESSKQSRLNALIGNELHGGSENDIPDLSLYGKIFNNPDKEDREQRLERFKQELLYPSVLIDKDNIPDSYFVLRLDIASKEGSLDELGYTNPNNVPVEIRQKVGEIIYSDQKISLDRWVDYLASPEANYPTWFKYYVLNSVVRMGTYNKLNHEFEQRTETTTTIFPDLNERALANTYEVLTKYYVKNSESVEKSEKEKFMKILDSANFSKIYALMLEKSTSTSDEKIEGDWVKFDKGSDATVLYESLQGKNTDWCTAGRETARQSLQDGDFYVFYTKDKEGNSTIPKIAISMRNGRIAEVRGSEPGQNLGVNFIDVAKEKYSLLPGGDVYEAREHDMNLLTLIDEKTQANQDLTIEELKFLYQIDGEIKSFGTTQDPRVRRIISIRDAKADLSLITGFPEDKIGITVENAFGGSIKYYYGDLCFWGGLPTYKDKLIFPEVVKGNIAMNKLTSANDLVLPKIVEGELNLSGLSSADGLILPESVGGEISLSSLRQDDKETLKKRYPNLKII